MSTFLLNQIKTELIDAVGWGNVSTREPDLLAYSLDYYVAPQIWLDRGLSLQKPDFIVHPENVNQVSSILKIASRHRIPVIPYSGGTGSQGGITPLYGGIIVDMKKMDRILNIDEDSYIVTSQPGINGYHLEKELNKKGYTLGHYPASVYGATLGGYIAARGAGTLSTKYGKAEDMVISLEVVSPQGKIIRTLPVPNHACGPSLLQLYVGSEGTLGVITEISIRIEPLPQVRKFNAYLFKDIKDGLEAGRRMMTEKRLRPNTIRLYDKNSSDRIVKKVLGLDLNGCYMVVGSEGHEEFVALEMKLINQVCTELDGIELGPESGEHWWNHRYDFYGSSGLSVLFK